MKSNIQPSQLCEAVAITSQRLGVKNIACDRSLYPKVFLGRKPVFKLFFVSIGIVVSGNFYGADGKADAARFAKNRAIIEHFERMSDIDFIFLVRQRHAEGFRRLYAG